MRIEIEPVGYVVSSRKEPTDDNWYSESAHITLADRFASDTLRGIEEFSHLEVLFYMHRAVSNAVQSPVRRPRGNANWPEVGIFAQRNSKRPNLIGLTIVELVEVADRNIHVRGLDAIDGTPVIDIKPWVREFAPRGKTSQPGWVTELMESYW